MTVNLIISNRYSLSKEGTLTARTTRTQIGVVSNDNEGVTLCCVAIYTNMAMCEIDM